MALYRIGHGQRVASTPRLTFGVAADHWFEALSDDLRSATRASYGHSLAHLRREFGRRRLDDITVTHVAAYVARQRRAGYKGSSVRSHLTAMGQVFAYAQRRLGFARSNPVGLLDRSER